MSLFHSHRWVATGVDNRVKRTRLVATDEWLEKVVYTIVHRVCLDCGDMEAREVEGTWKIEELNLVQMNQLKK